MSDSDPEPKYSSAEDIYKTIVLDTLEFNGTQEFQISEHTVLEMELQEIDPKMYDAVEKMKLAIDQEATSTILAITPTARIKISGVHKVVPEVIDTIADNLEENGFRLPAFQDEPENILFFEKAMPDNIPAQVALSLGEDNLGQRTLIGYEYQKDQGCVIVNVKRFDPIYIKKKETTVENINKLINILRSVENLLEPYLKPNNL
ncbi:hypothetical protein KC669_00450 [Candidatus Dojkabacteria bacterium]|uniref:Uncharacterized protein n=1 Tax=Candidatus Dojkabacteria bacterium TaxID=2099670 RepID=A0A955RL17_9BACT|nr:hypothetical protein [Candidatus Dojkabacteria bacterium]